MAIFAKNLKIEIDDRKDFSFHVHIFVSKLKAKIEILKIGELGKFAKKQSEKAHVCE